MPPAGMIGAVPADSEGRGGRQRLCAQLDSTVAVFQRTSPPTLNYAGFPLVGV